MARELGMALAWCAALATAACNGQEPSPSESVADTGPSPTATVTATAPATATATPTPAVPRRLKALGTEPFWAVDIDGTQLRYSTPEDQAGQSFTAVRRDSATASTWTGEVRSGRFELAISPGTCSDGMSDTVYPYSAVLTVGDQTNRGCARPPG